MLTDSSLIRSYAHSKVVDIEDQFQTWMLDVRTCMCIERSLITTLLINFDLSKTHGVKKFLRPFFWLPITHVWSERFQN